jgi:hypothetical protein
MGYGTRPHDWKLDELESMKTLSLCLCVGIRQRVIPCCVVQPVVVDYHACLAGMPH